MASRDYKTLPKGKRASNKKKTNGTKAGLIKNLKAEVSKALANYQKHSTDNKRDKVWGVLGLFEQAATSKRDKASFQKFSKQFEALKGVQSAKDYYKKSISQIVKAAPYRSESAALKHHLSILRNQMVASLGKDWAKEINFLDGMTLGEKFSRVEEILRKVTRKGVVENARNPNLFKPRFGVGEGQLKEEYFRLTYELGISDDLKIPDSPIRG